MKHSYPGRRLMRRLERFWSNLEGRLNRLTLASFNPLYHLGTLSVFLLLVLTLSGVYLALMYQPGMARAYDSVQRISDSWLGSLMRSIHRYSADGLMLTMMLHAFKMFLSDRFWGSRWLSWVSGWLLLAVVAFIGITGYWLVWDQRAQWLTESSFSLFGTQIALQFTGPKAATQTASLFVIVLFIHVFVPLLLVVGLLIHTARLSKTRWMPPRWLMGLVSGILVLVSVAVPAMSASPADLNRIIDSIDLDHWYLGFLLPARFIGLPLTMGLMVLIGCGLMALPWLLRGRHRGPAAVNADLCTGCGLCVPECPYEALEMKPRTDGDYENLAVVNSDLCTACGLCVGICAPGGINLVEMASTQLRQAFVKTLATEREAGRQPSALFVCQRHHTLGSMDGLRPLAADGETHVYAWPNQARAEQSLVVFPLACTGMLYPDWIREGLNHGATTAVIVSCPAHDCGSRHGPERLSERFAKREGLQKLPIHWIEAAPNDSAVVLHSLSVIAQQQAGSPSWIRSWLGNRSSRPTLRSLVGSVVVVAALIMLAGLSERRVVVSPALDGSVRLAFTHTGEIKQVAAGGSAELAAKLPEGVSMEQIVGGERYPMQLRLEVDGATLFEHEYQPAGLRNEGKISGFETFTMAPGEHTIRIWMMDDGITWEPVFDDVVQLDSLQVRALIFDQTLRRFVLY